MRSHLLHSDFFPMEIGKRKPEKEFPVARRVLAQYVDRSSAFLAFPGEGAWNYWFSCAHHTVSSGLNVIVGLRVIPNTSLLMRAKSIRFTTSSRNNSLGVFDG